MHPIIIVLITLFSYWILGTLIFEFTDEDETFAAYWTMGLVYFILFVLLYPFRLVRSSWHWRRGGNRK